VEIETLDLVKDYEGGVRALCGVSLAAGPGETLAIVGPSGSGKSTLLGLLGALEAPTSGMIRVDGKPLTAYRPLERFRAQRVGFVFQFHHLLPHLTMQENVEVPMVALGIRAQARRTRAAAILERMGLEHRAGFFPARVSGGERQRCAVARALVNGPDLLLADEPTGNLDSVSGGGVMEVLLEWVREAGATLIVATHDPGVADRSGRRLLLRDGRVVYAGGESSLPN
jgi:putative ABC transport system ATP-binding protein